MRGRDRCSGAGQPRLQSRGGNVHRRVRCGALRHGANALQENNLQGQKICSGREDIQRLRPRRAAAQLAVHFFLYSRTHRVTLLALHALENAVEYFRAHGFDLDKGTAQKLVSKVKIHLENLYKALGQAIVADNYICGDETYQKVRLQVATPSGRKIKKGYIWVFVGMTTGLVYFFYDDGSRSAEVFEQHIRGFSGAFQCDYYSGYRHIGIGEMSGIKRLPCLQHIKRKFLDLKDNPQAQEIAKLFGLLYHFEHQHRIGKDGWTEDDHLQWRQRYSKVMLEKIRMRLTAVKDRIGVPPDDPLLAATEHALRQWNEIPRIFASPTYKLDNNEVERINRYISLTRRRLTIGSHSGAEAAALYHSLAITCHQCGVNVFDYFCDIIDRCAAWPPNTPIEKYRDLLPDRWKPSQK